MLTHRKNTKHYSNNKVCFYMQKFARMSLLGSKDNKHLIKRSIITQYCVMLTYFYIK